MNEDNKVVMNPTKFWIIITLTAILGVGVGMILKNNSNQSPIIIQTTNN